MGGLEEAPNLDLGKGESRGHSLRKDASDVTGRKNKN